jgi:hypothetical protein
VLDEAHWLKNFFKILLETVTECSVINRYLISHLGETPSPNRIQPIFNALASNAHPDFVIMADWPNSQAKGKVSLIAHFTPKFWTSRFQVPR